MRDLGVKLPRTLYSAILIGSWIASFATMGVLFNLMVLPAAAMAVAVIYSLHALLTKIQQKTSTDGRISRRTVLGTVG